MAARSRVSPPVQERGSRCDPTGIRTTWAWSPLRLALPSRRAPHSAWAVLLAGAMLLSGCSLGQGSRLGITATASTVSTATPQPGPSPVATLLDPPPTDCPPSAPPPRSVPITDEFGLQGTGKLQGSPPVWIVGELSYPNSPLHLEARGYSELPSWKIVWEVGPNYTQPVQLQMRNLRTGERAWWGDESHWAGQAYLLDPSQPDVNGPYRYHGQHSGYPGALAGTWNEWGSVFVITAAGCYVLDVTWPGGQWNIFFAAGR